MTKIINADFEIVETKIISKVKFLNRKVPIDLIIDCGASMTTISPQLFKDLRLEVKDKTQIRIIGINSEEISYSTLVPSFIIGGVDLGEVRVAIGTMRPEFQDSILLGMNIIGWFDFGLSISNRLISLIPRRFKDTTIWERCFAYKNPKTKLLINEIEQEELTPSSIFSKK